MGSMAKLWHRIFPCRFQEPLCLDAPFGCRCGKGKGTAGKILGFGAAAPFVAHATGGNAQGAGQALSTAAPFLAMIPGAGIPLSIAASAAGAGLQMIPRKGQGGSNQGDYSGGSAGSYFPGGAGGLIPGLGNVDVNTPSMFGEQSNQQSFQNSQQTLQDLMRTQQQQNSLQFFRPEETGQGQELNQFLLQQVLGGQGGVTPEQQSTIVQESLRQLQPQVASMGLLDSGAQAGLSGRLANQLLGQMAQFNVQNRLGQSQLLSQRLAGLRPYTMGGMSNTTGFSSGQQFGSQQQQGGNTFADFRQQPNPFLLQMQQGLAQGALGGMGQVAQMQSQPGGTPYGTAGGWPGQLAGGLMDFLRSQRGFGGGGQYGTYGRANVPINYQEAALLNRLGRGNMMTRL